MAPKLTGSVLCAACYNEQPAKDHVDFQAEVDRGFYAEGTDNPVPLDDLILCEDCVKAAARLLGMEDSIERSSHIKALQSRVDMLERRVAQADRYAKTLEEAFEQRQEKIDHRRRPRPTAEQRQAASERMKQLHAEGKAGWQAKKEKEKEPVHG